MCNVLDFYVNQYLVYAERKTPHHAHTQRESQSKFMVENKASSGAEPGLYPSSMSRTAAIAQVASAYASKESSTVAEILELVDGLSRALYMAEQGAQSQAPVEAPAKQAKTAAPAVAIEDAVQDDKVVCLCCGQSFTMLKRHLKAEHGLTEDEYRKMFGLPASFPLVAPAYSARKAAYAKQAGLGKHDRRS